MPSLAPAKAVARNVLPSPLYRLYRKQHQAHEIRRFRSQTVTHNYGGVRLTVSLRDGLGKGWYDRDWDDVPEVAKLKRHCLRDDARVFDLGAHQAVIALILGQTVAPRGSVLAVEAEAHNCRVANENVSLNGASNVEVLHAAVSDAPGTIWFSEGLNGRVDGSASRLGKAPVRAVTIDELTEEHGAPDVVLLDVEGYEAKALRGAKRTLSEVRPQLLVEVHGPESLAQVGDTVSDVVAALDGYRLSVAHENGDFKPIAAAGKLLEQRCWLFADPN